VCLPGERVEARSTLVNKCVTVIANELTSPAGTLAAGAPLQEPKRVPSVYKGIEPAYVEKVMIAEDDDNVKLVKVLLRQTRVPEIGDKFSSRHGQKGTRRRDNNNYNKYIFFYVT